MSKVEPPRYSGMFLEPEEIEYQEIDPPLRNLIRLINSQPWIRTYGCCAGNAYHGEDRDDQQQFFLGFFVADEYGGINLLQSWLQEANRLNGPTGLRAAVESVHKHPFGQGSVSGWHAYRISVLEIRRRMIPSSSQAYLRIIKSLETALEKLWPGCCKIS